MKNGEIDLKKSRARSLEPPNLYRLPPHSIEAEQGVLGCILLDPSGCLPRCVEELGTSGDVFYDIRYQDIYVRLIQMFDSGLRITVETLVQELKKHSELEGVGGMFHVGQLPDQAPSAGNLDYWLPILYGKQQIRAMIQTCTEAVVRLYETTDEPATVLDEIERDVLGVRRVVSAGYSSMKELASGAVQTMENYHQRQGALRGLATGFVDFDKMTGGLMPGDMVVIAARPSVGKSSMALNIAEHVAIQEHRPVGIFSLEMSKESLAFRSLCSRSRVNARDVRDGFLAERDFRKIASAAGKLSQAPIFVADVSSLSIMELRARARRMKQKEKIELLIVDYLQLLSAPGRKSDSRQQEITTISQGIKQMAKELNIPVIALSQLNRDMEKNKGRKPMLSDLRESGAIEQDADVVCLMYRKEVDEYEDNAAESIGFIIAKQRNGPTGEIPLLFLKAYTRFESASKVSDDDARS